MRLLSVNVSLPKEIHHQGEIVRTGIFKEPVRGRVWLRMDKLEGDGQGDLSAHGDAHKVAYAYPFEHYAHWQAKLGRDGFPFGQFGENFTVEGMLEDDVHNGDEFRVGDAVVQVTQPRFPCKKLGIRMKEPRFPQMFMDSGLTGFYLLVLREGEVGAGDCIERVQFGHELMSVRDLWRLRHLEPGNTEGIRKALRIAALAPGWRELLERRLARATS